MLRRCATDSGLRTFAKRSFGKSTARAALNPTPLTEANPLTDSEAGVLLDFPVLRNAKYSPFNDEGTKVTKLESGTVVVSRDAPDPIASVGVFVTGGVSTECFPGVSHLMRHMTFQRSYTRSPLAVNRSLEELTPRFSAVASRDYFAYTAEVNRDHIDTLYEYVCDMRNPKPHEYIIKDIADNVRAESIAAQSDPLTSLVEDIHKEGYRDVGYGASLYAPLHSIDKFAPEHVASFSNNGQLVVVGYGTEHDTLLKIVGEGERRTAAENSSVYKGGERRTAGPGNTNVAIVFEGPSLGSEHWAAAQVLKNIAGGASRISKDGPGRGLAGRLYTGVVAPDENIQAATTFTRSYAKSGLFGGYVESLPGNAESATLSLADALASLGASVSDEELARGKRQAKAGLSYLSRSDRVELMASLTVAGSNPDTDSLLKSIDNVGAADVTAVARKVLSSAPTLVANGDVAGIPTREEVAARLK